MFTFENMSRKRAATIHLVVSATIALFSCLLIVLVWYPGAFFDAFGGNVLLALIVGVDVCLGPLMTLILFNPKKSRRELTVDLSLVALVQIGALIYGMYTTYVARPVYVIFYQDHFASIMANDIDQAWLKEAKNEEYKKLPLWGPRWVAVPPAGNTREESDYSFYEALRPISGIGVELQIKYYVPLQQQQKNIQAVAKDLSVLYQYPEKAKELDKVISNLGKNQQQIAYLPLFTKRQTLTVLIDKLSGEVLKVVEVDPN